MRIWTVEEVNEHRTAYLTALRSGEYVQGKHQLTTLVAAGLGDSYEKDCCLGVACKVAIHDGVVEKVRGGGMFSYHATDDHVGPRGSDVQPSVLPYAVARWLGLPETVSGVPVTDPDIAEYRSSSSIGIESRGATFFNDSAGWSFHQIADAFESYFEANPPTVNYNFDSSE